MKVLVATAVAENERDLLVVMAARVNEVMMVSPIVTLEGKATNHSGNPYMVYGDAVEGFTGCSKYDCDISVFDCVSGDLEGWYWFD